MPTSLRALLMGNFVVGCGVMALLATLPEISTSLDVPVAQAGLLVTASAAVVALCAPVLALVLSGWDRRRLLASAMLWYGLLQLACAAMPGLESLAAARMLAMVSPAIFTPQAANCAGMLVPAAQRGRAITFVFLGFSASAVAGLPIAAWVSGAFGWRSAFALIGLLAIANAAWLWRALPRGLRPPLLPLERWADVLRAPAVMICLAVTLVSATAQFVIYTYFAPYLKLRLGMTALDLSLLLAWIGICGLTGNAVMSRFIDRIGPANSVLVSLAFGCVGLLAWPLGTGLLSMAAVIAPWALGYFAINSAQQARLAALVPVLAPVSIALNTSSVYAGQALGAAIGGALVAAGRWNDLHWAALAGMLAAMWVSVLAGRMAMRRRAA